MEKTKIVQKLDAVFEKISKSLEVNPSDSAIPHFRSMLMQIREELSKPDVKTGFLRGAAGGLSRIIHESIWADTELGDEILNFLVDDLRQYEKKLEDDK